MKKKEKEFKIRYSHLNLYQQYQASNLFERPPTQDYIKEWTNTLAQPVSEKVEETLSILIFRLGMEWFALPTVVIKEVTSRRIVHRIPHRSNNILSGVVNLNGELKLYVALEPLLEVQADSSPPSSRMSYHQDRMIAIAKNNEFWAFPVDEIDGIYNCNLAQMENVPVNVSKSSIGYIMGIIKLENKAVGLIDEQLLFTSLKRSIQ